MTRRGQSRAKIIQIVITKTRIAKTAMAAASITANIAGAAMNGASNAANGNANGAPISRERRDYEREYGAGPGGHHFIGLRFGLPFVLIPLIGIAILVAFFTALFRFPFILLALLLGGYLYATHRRHHHFYPAGGYHRDVAPDDATGETAMRDVTPPRAPQTPPQANPQD